MIGCDTCALTSTRKVYVTSIILEEKADQSKCCKPRPDVEGERRAKTIPQQSGNDTGDQ